MERNKKRANPLSSPSPIVSVLIGGGIGLAVTLVSALIAPFLMLKSQDPNALLLAVSAVCVFMGGFVGAFVASRLNRQKPFVFGLLSSLVIFVPIVLVSLFTRGEGKLIGALAVALSLVLSALLGSLAAHKLGSNKKSQMKKALKRR